MKHFVRVVAITIWLLGIWQVGQHFSSPMLSISVAQGGCPNINVACPSDCNYARDPYGGPVKRCTEVGSYPNITCCLYWCQMFRCRRRGMPQGEWCGLSQDCRLASATYARCIYLSGQGWECK